jgi:hypothetical protein
MLSSLKKLFVGVALLLAMLPLVAAEETDPAVVVLFMFFGLGIGVIVTQLQSALWGVIPYTVVIFFVGVGFAVMVGEREGKTMDAVAHFIFSS